jgi:peptidoglycan/xylan/chitin deacetylase (PgdA/CDA1 family)
MRSKPRKTGGAFAICIALASLTACLKENPEPIDLAAVIDSYPDKGRLAIDPHTQTGVISLTFDDGPSEYTKDIIDTLVRHGAEGTFFMVGRLIPAQRDVLEYARARGQQTASHSYNHEAQPGLSEDIFKSRVGAVWNNLENSDRGRLYFRFPYGAAGDDQLRWLSELEFGGKRYKPVGWHMDSQDFDYDRQYAAGAPFSTNILDDTVECGGQKNPFQKDMVSWCQFIARKTEGGVMLFHDTKRITRDLLEEIMNGFESPERYFASLPANLRAEYIKYYECEKVDRTLRFRHQPLWGGAWPSLRD